MNRFAFLIVALTGISAFFVAGSAVAERIETEKVKVPLENYLKGHETGDPEYMRKAFHSEGKLMFIRDGKYTTVEFKDYIGRMPGTPAKDEAERKRYIESIDITGSAATAKIVLDYPGARLVDYMSLLKIDGEWKIVNKIFNSEPKPKE